MKLNPNFSHVRANILMQYPLPPISHAYRLLAQEEEHKAISENIPEDSHAMFANKGRPSEHRSNSGIIPYRPPHSSEKSSSQRKSSYFCDYCKKTGHTKDRCYRLHGLPSNSATKSNWKNNKVVALVDLENPDPHKLQSTPAGSNSFTTEQYNMLLHLINQQKKEASPILAEDSNTACFLAGEQCLFSTNNALWIIDSGATNHITYNLDLFDSFQPFPSHFQNHITLPDGSQALIKHHGNIPLNSEIMLQDVLHVPQFHFNLISVTKLCRDLSCTVSFSNNTCSIQGPSLKTPIQLGNLKHGLYYCQSTPVLSKPSVQDQASSPRSCYSAISDSNNAKLWHLRLGHPPFNVIKNVLPTLRTSSYEHSSFCKICPAARQSRLSFPTSHIKTIVPFELLHLDIWGPYKHCTHHGCTMFLTIVDDFTRTTWIYLMKYKSDAVSIFKSFYSYVKTQFNALIKSIRSDNAPDLCEGHMKDFLLTKGITHYKACSATPQQNGVVERKHKHLLETARALSFQSNLPKQFWGECVLTAAYLINRMPLQSLGLISPQEKLLQTKPNLSHLRSFGCLCFISTKKMHITKFDARAHPCVFIGYPNLQKAYKVYDLVTKKVLISRDVIFFEKHFPFHLQTTTSSHSSPFYPFFLPLTTNTPDYTEDDVPPSTRTQHISTTAPTS